MGFRIVGLDINDNVLAAARDVGAEFTFNSMTNKEYAKELKAATGGGAHTAAVFSESKAAYDGAPDVLRMNGLIMAIELMLRPLKINSIAFMRGLFHIKSTVMGPLWKMPKTVEFTAKHSIKTNVSFHKLNDINNMIEQMKSGKSTGRMAVVF